MLEGEEGEETPDLVLEDGAPPPPLLLPPHRYNFSGPSVDPDCLADCDDAKEEQICREVAHT